MGWLNLREDIYEIFVNLEVPELSPGLIGFIICGQGPRTSEKKEYHKKYMRKYRETHGTSDRRLYMRTYQQRPEIREQRRVAALLRRQVARVKLVET